MDSRSSYVLDIDAAPPPTIEYHYTVRQYCHNCGKYGHLNEVNVLGIKFALCDDCFKEFRERQNYCPVLTHEKTPWWMNPNIDANKVTC